MKTEPQKSEAITLTDVTLRDGLQAESKTVPLDSKLQLLNLLSQCQFNRLEITSFVNPKWIPQLGDAEKLCESWFKKGSTQETMAFVPNTKGCERLLKFPIPWVSCFVAASPTFNQKNVNCTIDESLKEIESIISVAKNAKRKIRVYVSTVWGCPYEKEITASHLEPIFQKLSKSGADEIALSDTIGVATPSTVRAVLSQSSKFFPFSKIALHLHNTYGFALANVQTAYDVGVRSFDGSLGGVGGCPYARGATGNIASDDLRNLFFRQGKLKNFPKPEIEKTLDYLRNELGLVLNSSLSKIQEKGGSWYGIE
ncbi:MAG: hydroxymethylglutaryl-CoA lyase [Proteobacteria bacterium]|nr:hydroxymethylglutaryl-CoA lyase [Pseudomonadota bacterium]